MNLYKSVSRAYTLNSSTKLTFQVPPSLKAERTYTLDFLRETKNIKNNKIVKLHIKRMFLLRLIYDLSEKLQSTIAYKIHNSIIILTILSTNYHL